MNNIVITPQGLINDGINGYEMRSPYSFIRYGHEPSTNMFYIFNVGTIPEYRHKGYATALLENLFQHMSEHKRAALDEGTYTGSGEDYIKPVVEKFSKQYNIPLIKGREF